MKNLQSILIMSVLILFLSLAENNIGVIIIDIITITFLLVLLYEVRVLRKKRIAKLKSVTNEIKKLNDKNFIGQTSRSNISKYSIVEYILNKYNIKFTSEVDYYNLQCVFCSSNDRQIIADDLNERLMYFDTNNFAIINDIELVLEQYTYDYKENMFGGGSVSIWNIVKCYKDMFKHIFNFNVCK